MKLEDEFLEKKGDDETKLMDDPETERDEDSEKPTEDE